MSTSSKLGHASSGAVQQVRFSFGWLVFAVCLVGAMPISTSAATSYQVREWTNLDGRSFDGVYLSSNAEAVRVLSASDHKVFTLHLAMLSEEDIAYIESLNGEPAKWVSDGSADSAAVPESLEWPKHLRVGVDYAMEVVEEDRTNNRFIYRSNHFEFHSDVPLTERVAFEFGRVFEATFMAIDAMPFDWNPEPPFGCHYKVRLFGTEAAYRAAGGPANSGGVYAAQTRDILVPLTSVGMRQTSRGYTFDFNANMSMLIHEITHQVHHEWLGKLPIWLVEGLAVYMETVPYRRGEFRFDRRNTSAEVGLRLPNREFIDFETMFEMGNREWIRAVMNDLPQARVNYATSFLMTEYFFHHDDGGRRMYAYLRAIERGVPHSDAVEYLLDGRDVFEMMDDFIQSFDRQRIRLISIN